MDKLGFEKIRDRIDTDDIDLRENYRRETYKLVKELAEDEEDDRLIMLKGMRKVGKTVILKQLTVDLDKTLYLDASVSEDLDWIVNYGYEIRQLIRKGEAIKQPAGKCQGIRKGEVKYLIIDEVSRIADISKVRRLYDSCPE